MGYCTAYKLGVQGSAPDELQRLVADLKARSESAEYALNDDGSTCESCKWYDHENELRKFSKTAPTRVFVLSGWGEDSGDIWRKYFRDGKCQVAKAEIIIPEFSERLLV